jgi:heme/copper-type cytochrome/quinol oxidase subunit 2
MPIVIEAIPPDQFATWVKETKNKYAQTKSNTLALAIKDN